MPLNILRALIFNHLILITDNDPAKHKRNAIRPLQGSLHLLLHSHHNLDHRLRPHHTELHHQLLLLLQLLHQSVCLGGLPLLLLHLLRSHNILLLRHLLQLSA
jgi:hypothetical protein